MVLAACASGGGGGEGGSTTTTSWTTSDTGGGGAAGGGATGGSGGSAANGGSAAAGGSGAAGGGGSGGTGGTAGAGGSGGTGGTAGAGGSGGTGGAGGSGGGGSGPYRHTITIDGTNDFVIVDERFATTTGSPFFGYYAWDATYLYVGIEGPDVAGGAGSDTKWVLIYIGGSPGTTQGVAYGALPVQPLLPFNARYQIQWRMNNALTLALEWSGSTWQDAGWDFTGDVYQSGTFVEFRVPLSDIGSPSVVNVHLSMINESNGNEHTWAGVPSTSFTDAADPDYGSYFAFDLSGTSVPTSYSPQ